MAEVLEKNNSKYEENMKYRFIIEYFFWLLLKRLRRFLFNSRVENDILLRIPASEIFI
jgi:hypothetical protein